MSIDGGEAPAWAPSGRELFYLDGAHRMAAVPVATGETFRAGNQEILFRASESAFNRSFRQYDVMPDGKSFVMSRDQKQTSGHVVVVFNFLEELKRLTSQR